MIREAIVEEASWNSYDCLPRLQFLKTMPPSDKGFWYWGVGFLKDFLHKIKTASAELLGSQVHGD